MYVDHSAQGGICLCGHDGCTSFPIQNLSHYLPHNSLMLIVTDTPIVLKVHRHNLLPTSQVNSIIVQSPIVNPTFTATLRVNRNPLPIKLGDEYLVAQTLYHSSASVY